MNKLITSTLLTLSAVPFLMAAPAASKVQNQSTTATQAKTAKKTHKSHAKKNSKATGTDAAAPSAAQPK